jgi:hypothetical protein
MRDEETSPRFEDRRFAARPGRRALHLGLVLGVLPLLTGCFASLHSLPLHDALSGTVELESPGRPPVTFTPVLCESGQRQSFFGVDFADERRHVVRLIVSPIGAATVRVFDAATPLEAGAICRRGDCSRFELELDPSGWRVNDVDDVGVRIAFDCRTPDGAHASGELASEHCH